MAKTTALKKTTTKTPPIREVTLSLQDPDMDLLLRAGIGGLATTLRAIEKQDAPFYCEEGSPESEPPWRITKDSITLTFPDPENIAIFLESIFSFAFSIHDDLIALRPTYVKDLRPNPQILASIQQGLMLTFLQHGKSRSGEKADVERSYEIDGKPV